MLRCRAPKAYNGGAAASRMTTSWFRGRFCSASSTAAAEGEAAAWHFTTANKSVSRWLFGCAGVVSSVIVIGGVTRLTESGLSITKWRPVSGVKPPLTHEEWMAEFEEYKKFPEYQQRPDMTLSDFKFIFFWEWAHRVLARSLGVVFGVPALYFGGRRYFRGHPGFKAGLATLFCLGGFQGALGWYMVKSGLDQRLLDERKKATVSAYRLASHLTTAFSIYSGMIIMAVALRFPHFEKTFAGVPVKSLKAFRGIVHGATGLMFTTAVSGAFVAGLDAGLLYNDTFPFMGEGVFPPLHDITTEKPLWKNLFENHSAAQLWHRMMAGSTTLAVVGMNVAASRRGLFSVPIARKAIFAVNGALTLQVLLGFSTILSYVVTPVAASHQAGSIVLLSTLLYLSAMLSARGRMLGVPVAQKVIKSAA